MPGPYLFEYCILRYVPRVERGEQINIGVVLYCKEAGFLDMRYRLDEGRVRAFYPAADTDLLCLHLRSIALICKGDPEAIGIASMDQSFRFRWVAANRSTIIQTSPIHPGLCDDPAEKLDQLYEDLVR